jgi:hypothetical protein
MQAAYEVAWMLARLSPEHREIIQLRYCTIAFDFGAETGKPIRDGPSFHTGHITMQKSASVRCLFTRIARSGFLALCLASFVQPLAAVDDSGSHAIYYNDDNCGHGYSAFYPQEAWAGLDMIYHQGSIFETYFVPYDRDHLDQVVTLFVYKRPAASDKDIPAEKPSHLAVREEGQTYSTSVRRHSASRMAVFRDQLYLFNGKGYDGKDYKSNTGFILWGRQWDPVAGNFPSTGAANLWERRPGNPLHPTSHAVIKGLVVKTLNDKLYLLIQPNTTNELWVITYDGVAYSEPTKIHTFAGNDCILNGDVFMRTIDGEPMLAFVTKDDSHFSGDPTGACKLYVFDPLTTGITKVADFPDKYKDVAMVQGDVLGCAPYSTGAMQIWGIAWSEDGVYHSQFVFDPDGIHGTFNPTGRVRAASVSGHVETSMRGYLAACAAPEQVDDIDLNGNPAVSLRMRNWVWWWGSTTSANVFGRSLKYKADYLRNLGPEGSPTPGSLDGKVNDAWSLLGVITGLPPYYGNGVDPEKLESFYKVSYGIKHTLDVSTTVKTDGSLGFSYSKEGIFGLAKASMGFSYSTAVEEVNKKAKETTVETTIELSPSVITPSDMPNGNQAWGVFLAPYITSDRYGLYTPDRDHSTNIEGTDLGLKLYYTYIGDNSSIVTQKFDMTNPDNPFNSSYFTGLHSIPNSLRYEDWPEKGPAIISTGTSDYRAVMVKQILTTDSGYDHSFDRTVKVENEHANTNKVSIKGGFYGFETEVEGSITMASANSTALGQNISVHYAVPTFEAEADPPEDYSHYLTGMDMYMYLLNAKTSNAFFVPDGAKRPGMQQYPWCLTWMVNSYRNMANRDATMLVGGAQPYDTLSGALTAAPDTVNIDIRVHTSIADSPIAITGKAVTVRGAPSTLDTRGNPTVVVRTKGITVADSAYLRLENVILDAEGGVPAIVNNGALLLKNCTILGERDVAGIVQNQGTLNMDRTRVSSCGGDGLRILDGHATLINCMFTRNARGIANENGKAVIKNCGMLANRSTDLYSGASADTEAVNCVVGKVADGSRLARLQNCLVETSPKSVAIDLQESSILGKRSGYLIKYGELTGIRWNSPCINAGTPSANVPYDFSGRLRGDTPDIGPLEYARQLSVKGVTDLELITLDADAFTPSDYLSLGFDVQVPPGFTLSDTATYALRFGKSMITSDQFSNSTKGRGSLVFSNASGDSYLRMDQRQRTLRVRLSLLDVQLQHLVAEYVMDTEDPSSATSKVYMPMQFSAGGYQTGEVWMTFNFEGRNAVGKGTSPRLQLLRP